MSVLQTPPSTQEQFALCVPRVRNVMEVPRHSLGSLYFPSSWLLSPGLLTPPEQVQEPHSKAVFITFGCFKRFSSQIAVEMLRSRKSTCAECNTKKPWRTFHVNLGSHSDGSQGLPCCTKQQDLAVLFL